MVSRVLNYTTCTLPSLASQHEAAAVNDAHEIWPPLIAIPVAIFSGR